MKYKNYDPLIKKMIVDSGDVSLYKEFNIPRSTVRYWIGKSKDKKAINIDRTYEI